MLMLFSYNKLVDADFLKIIGIVSDITIINYIQLKTHFHLIIVVMGFLKFIVRQGPTHVLSAVERAVILFYVEN